MWSMCRSSAAITRQSRMISGRVPIIVMTLSLATRHLGGIGISPVRIEDLAGPEEDDHLAVTNVFDTVCHTGRDVHDFELAARHAMRCHRSALGRPEPDHGVAFEDAELLHLQVVIVMPAGDARQRPRYEDLA